MDFNRSPVQNPKRNRYAPEKTFVGRRQISRMRLGNRQIWRALADRSETNLPVEYEQKYEEKGSNDESIVAHEEAPSQVAEAAFDNAQLKDRDR